MKTNSRYRQYYPLLIVIFIGLLIRLYFQIGHIFSDDAYYSYISYSLVRGDFADNYLGYPVFPLRIGFIGLTSLSMIIFGSNEFATIILPFLFSIFNIVLTYKLTNLLTNESKIALSASILVVFFPTDIIFASIGFPDLINVFFINLGIFYLFKSHLMKNKSYAYLGGLSFFLSMQFKENIYYILILLIILLFYFLVKKKRFIFQLLVGILFIVVNYFIEGFIYLLLYNEFLYRIIITNVNYSYSYYDFFPYTAQKLSNSKNYFRNLFDQIFLINIKSIFLRRFYLFLPIIASVQSFFSVRKREYSLLVFWFIGTAFLLITFTTSFTEYKPLDLSRSWYIYPLLMPMVILSAIFINRYSRLIRNGLFTIYILGSLIMCFQYQVFFNSKNLDELKFFIRENSTKMIYTDHFTKYSVDLIRAYEGENSERILGKDFNISGINSGSWILYNKNHIDELRLQHFEFPDFSILKSRDFKKVASFKDFIFYEKLP